MNKVNYCSVCRHEQQFMGKGAFYCERCRTMNYVDGSCSLDPEIIWTVLYWRMLKGLSKNTGISIQGLLDHVSAVEEWERK